MKIKLSSKGYKLKPSKEQMIEITNGIKNSNNVELTIPSIAHYLERGYSVALANFRKRGSISKENIESINLLAIDIDSKENAINMLEMKSLVYNKLGVIPCIEYRTFSDVDNTKFRLIYELDVEIDSEVYESLYKAISWKLGKYIDNATCNANRIWAGTDKVVQVNYDSIGFDFNKIVKLLENHEKAKARKKKVVTKAILGNNEGLDGKYIKREFKCEIADIIRSSIDLKSYIQSHFGGDWKPSSGSWKSKCVLPSHGGDGSGHNLSVKGQMYTCFSHCGSGDIFSIARMVYNTKDFSVLCFKLAEEYNIKIDNDMLGVLRNE